MSQYSDFEIDLKSSKTTGEVLALCPKCSADRKKKNLKCLSVNLDKKVWRCNHCAWKGALRIEYEDPKVYQKPLWKNKTELSAKCVKWFEGRKISQKTLLEARITEGNEYMPQVSKECNTIQFNYFRGQELINVKYRDGAKNFKLAKDAELIFYNINSISESKEIFITEGEIDCLSLIEAGYKNCISVPNGANLNTNNLKYINNCIDLFNGITKIHIAVDNDLAGRRLRDEIADRFGKDRCDFLEFKESKDANECLQKFGIQGIIDSCSKPKEFPLEGTFTISDYSDAIDDMYENGLDKGASTFIPKFDLNIVKGYITVITGIPSHGKSDWVDNICLHLKIKHGWCGAFYSPENKPTELHFSKMARKLIGKHWDGWNRMSMVEVESVKRFLEKKFWFIKPEKDFSLTSILNQIRNLQLRYGLDFFVIDAWNKLEHKDTDTHSVGKAMDELATFCEVNNLHCFLVAHPAKMKKENGVYEVPTLYNIMGSSNFYAKADNGICVYRDFQNNKTTIYVQKIKFDHWGREGSSDYSYDIDSKRYFALGYPSDSSNWITNEQKQLTLPENTTFLTEPKRISEPKEDNWEVETPIH